MAYSNFPVGYHPAQMYYPQGQGYMAQNQQPQNPQPQTNGGIIWVQGEAGAKSYLVAPNTTVQLWDSENQVIYLKSADASGMPSMRVLDYTIRDSAQHNVVSPSPNVDYVTRSDLDAFESKMNARFAEIMNNREVSDAESLV